MMMFSGGPVCWILLAMALVALVIFFARLIDLRRAQVDSQDFLKGVINVLDANNPDEALAICEDTPAPAAQVVATAIRHRDGSARVLREAVDAQGRAEIGRLDRRFAALAIIAQVSPLLGLFGTVVGFAKTLMAVQTTDVISRIDLFDAALPALSSAALGLAVAILASILYGSLRVRLDRTVVEMEAAASQIVGYIATRKEEHKK